MPTQLALRFEDVPVTCPVQARYHSIAPGRAGIKTPAEQAQQLNLGYSTITRWLREFRAHRLPGLVPATTYAREPYTAEKVIVLALYFKCCVPTASDRVIESSLGQRLHNRCPCAGWLRRAPAPSGVTDRQVFRRLDSLGYCQDVHLLRLRL
jgi:hypothetical protein